MASMKPGGRRAPEATSSAAPASAAIVRGGGEDASPSTEDSSSTASMPIVAADFSTAHVYAGGDFDTPALAAAAAEDAADSQTAPTTATMQQSLPQLPQQQRLGVSFYSGRQAWVAEIKSKGRRRFRVFSAAKYGFAAAQLLALQQRQQWEAAKETGVLEEQLERSSSSRCCPVQSGVKGVYYDRARKGWRVVLTSKNRQRSRFFLSAKFGSEEAKRLAIQCRHLWLQQISSGREGDVFKNARSVSTPKHRLSAASVLQSAASLEEVAARDEAESAATSNEEAALSFAIVSAVSPRCAAGTAAPRVPAGLLACSVGKRRKLRQQQRASAVMASFSAATSNPDPEANTATAAAAIGACDVRGVYHDIRNSAWAATIGFNGKTLKRSFAVGKHGFSAALKLAIQARKKLETLRARCNRGRGDGEACNSSRVQIGQQAVEAAGVNQHQSQTSTSSCLAGEKDAVSTMQQQLQQQQLQQQLQQQQLQQQQLQQQLVLQQAATTAAAAAAVAQHRMARDLSCAASVTSFSVAASGAVAAAGGAGSSEVPSSTSMSIPGVSLHAGPGATRAGAKNLISTFLPLPPCGNLETAGSSSNRANSGSCNALLEGRFGLKSTVAEALTVLLHQSDLQRAMLGSSKFQCTQQELLRQPFLLREQQLLLQQFQLQQQQQLMDGQLKDEQQATVLRAAAAAAAAVGLPGITTTHLTDSNAAVDAVTALLVRPCPPTVGKQEEFRDAGGEAAAEQRYPLDKRMPAPRSLVPVASVTNSGREFTAAKAATDYGNTRRTCPRQPNQFFCIDPA
ncbi:polyglutamine-repeat protein pqn-41-like [Cyclospora cayetanensis]|uniref:Polyglutamine-repeat protein pqn-41-like n=1 Tax=Cyclospora cayetanensis TaxID=88456 RepID=A0A6P6RQT1_9EIME|nr:polyglutamine-repeat protein pqn-41-like [Cyclospora cayetanensis]